MRKSNSYYTTACTSSPHSWAVQKLDPESLLPVQKPHRVTQLEGSAFLCNCIARVTECRHIKIVKKFADQIGQHPPYDIDNDRFYADTNQPPDWMTEV